jgi:hypothetical protein
MDLYKRERRIEAIKQRFKQECNKCYALIERFEHDLKLNSYSAGRIEKYWCFLKKIHELLGTYFENAERRHLEALVIKIDQNNAWSDWTKADFKRIVNFLSMA